MKCADHTTSVPCRFPMTRIGSDTTTLRRHRESQYAIWCRQSKTTCRPAVVGLANFGDHCATAQTLARTIVRTSIVVARPRGLHRPTGRGVTSGLVTAGCRFPATTALRSDAVDVIGLHIDATVAATAHHRTYRNDGDQDQRDDAIKHSPILKSGSN